MTENGNHINAAMDQAVADRFDALLAAIDTSAEHWWKRSEEASRDRDGAKAQECLLAIQHSKETQGEVKALNEKWKDKWSAPVVPPVATPIPHPHTRRPASKLRVHVNGQVIEYSTAAETFARTIEALSIEKVSRLGKVLSGIPLIGTTKATGYHQQFLIGKLYVCTHSSTQAKKRLLEEIATDLGTPVRVEIT